MTQIAQKSKKRSRSNAVKPSYVLVISSQVSYGHVGANAALPALQALGIETILLPTVLFSNHPGHAGFSGSPVETQKLRGLYKALTQLGIERQIGAVLSGYFASPAQVRLAAQIIDGIKDKNPQTIFCCDPIAGDDGRLYVPPATAKAIKHHLLPRADILTPNRFELGFFSGLPSAEIEDISQAALTLRAKEILVTSARRRLGKIATLLITQQENRLAWTQWHRLQAHGLGDTLCALYLGWRMKGMKAPEALLRAQAGLTALIEETARTRAKELIFAGRAGLLAHPAKNQVTMEKL